MTLHDNTNRPLPFWTIATAETEGGTASGIVDETGTVFQTEASVMPGEVNAIVSFTMVYQ